MTYTMLEGKSHLSNLVKNRLVKGGGPSSNLCAVRQFMVTTCFLKVKKLSWTGTIRYFLIVHARICATFC